MAAPIKKKRRSLLSGRRWGGSFKHRRLEVERTTPSAPVKGTGPFTGWRVHPSFAKEGSLDLPVACVSWSGAKREIRGVCSGLLKKALLKMSKLQSAVIDRRYKGLLTNNKTYPMMSR